MILPREQIRVPMPKCVRRAVDGPRKRWPAIEPHWRALYFDGVTTSPMSHGSARQYARMCRDAGIAIVAIIKVTPK